MIVFSAYEYFVRHPFQKKIATWWIMHGLPIPEKMKRQMINQVHIEMIVRLMDEVVSEGTLSIEKAMTIHYQIGKEIADQTKEFLDPNPLSAKELSLIIDFLHNLLDIRGKKIMKATDHEAISHWYGCPHFKRLSESSGGGPFYCHLYQEMYKGVLKGINPNAEANSLSVTKSQGAEYCELHTWIKQN